MTLFILEDRVLINKLGELVIAIEESRQNALFQKDQQEYPLKVNAPSEASLFSQTKGRIRMKIKI